MKQESTPTISSFIDQVKFKLIGFQAFYKDGSNKFYTNLKDIEEGFISNPLVDVKQVGEPQKDFIDQISDVLLLRLKANTDDKSMSYEMALKVDPGSISLKQLREILVLAGIKKITVENATIKTIN